MRPRCLALQVGQRQYLTQTAKTRTSADLNALQIAKIANHVLEATVGRAEDHVVARVAAPARPQPHVPQVAHRHAQPRGVAIC